MLGIRVEDSFDPSVSIPGMMQLTVMLYCAHSRAAVRVNAWLASLAAL